MLVGIRVVTNCFKRFHHERFKRITAQPYL
jgi:hypothetical protein